MDTLQPTGAWSAPSNTKVALPGPQVARTVPELLLEELEGRVPPPEGVEEGLSEGVLGVPGVPDASGGVVGALEPPAGALGSEGLRAYYPTRWCARI
ncbi:MAG: hypothetical protein HC852_05030 [Acaryochloridaceae cyanobacterium RU_4_10]|nr:hypothetical protein [Acaryochloridaceae cyanobacterium RU_4_10]